MPELIVTEAGWSTVQDLGRVGLSRYGVARGGASDQYSARCAHALVANDAHRPLVEVTARDFAFEAGGDLLVAVTGASCEVHVNGWPAAAWRPIAVPSGARVEVRGIHDGLRCYVAVHGVLDVAPVLGSVAPDPGLGLGTTLTDGTRLGLESGFRYFEHPFSGIPLLLPRVAVPATGSPWLVDVVEGPDAHEFAATAHRLTDRDYAVTDDSDTMGLRLAGEAPQCESDHEIVSRGVAIGAVEVTPSGELLVLLRRRMLTAGYPVIAVATTVAQPRLGQARPSDVVRFRLCSLADALREAREERAGIERVARAVRVILGSCADSGVAGSADR